MGELRRGEKVGDRERFDEILELGEMVEQLSWDRSPSGEGGGEPVGWTQLVEWEEEELDIAKSAGFWCRGGRPDSPPMTCTTVSTIWGGPNPEVDAS